MLERLLNESDKSILYKLLQLMAIADKPLLWNGRSTDEVNSKTDLDLLSFKRGESEDALLADILGDKWMSSRSKFEFSRQLAIMSRTTSFLTGVSTKQPVRNGYEVEGDLIEKLKTFPILKVDAPESRLQAATMVLRKLIEKVETQLPSVSKLILFELMLMALCNGNISSIQFSLLKELQSQYKLDDFIFNDILERAESMNRECNKIISIILE